MVIVILLVVLTVLVTANWYLWRRLFRDTTRAPGLARRAGAVLIAGGWALAVGALVAERAGAPFWLQRTLAWPGFLWLALSIYLLLTVVAGEAVRPLLRWFLKRRAARVRAPAAAGIPRPEPVPAGAGSGETGPSAEPAEPAEPGEPRESGGSGGSARDGGGVAAGNVADPSRRVFVSRVVAGAAAAVAVGTVGAGTYGVLNGPAVKRVTVPLAKLPRAAHGFRIAVVSDIHLGPVLGRGFAQKVVDTINSTQPDLIAVVGDLVDGSVKDLGPAAAPLAQLSARHGAYFVTGNHEYFSGAGEWVEEVRRLGLRPLENARTELRHFDLAGVNDVAGEDEGEGPDFQKALGDRDRGRACVLLAHQPVQIHDAVDHGVDLQLSGHTHGGQLWPGNLLAAAANPTVAGLERYGDTQLYVTRGAGAWGPPTRVGAESDITVVELASREA
ncbi:metallophosphoesterase [Streptomyces sp. B93]|uniref:metallophosphoesterase n=1 Tax=Streptomyces sp. B93 TaxID=2824875 RepID=UPI001B36B738|nr:metallophosphoesterase [Streptomyces sp. B93]MBQ1090222.1 metallophosphoesterase [Streptomyces sp. B93]